ncbi:MAG TPA: hypothetical protein VIF02_01745 [Methylocella sp.]
MSPGKAVIFVLLAVRRAISPLRSGRFKPPEAFDVVSDHGEMDLALCLGKPEPSHRAEMIAAFPSPENLLDPGTDRPQRAVVCFELFSCKPAMAFAHELCGSALGSNCRLDRQRIIGFIAINLARLFRDNRGSNRDIGLIGRRGCDVADNAGVLVRRKVGLIAMRGRAAFVLYPGGLAIAFGCRADDGRIDERALADNRTLGLKIARDRLKQTPVEPMCDELTAEAEDNDTSRTLSKQEAEKRAELSDDRE